jgi:small subunit ribosomal protein S16
MVVVRLARAGAKKRPFYHIVVTDSRKRRDSNYITRIGYFNPGARGGETRLHLETEKLKHWQSVGAQLSDRVASLAKEFNKQENAAVAG